MADILRGSQDADFFVGAAERGASEGLLASALRVAPGCTSLITEVVGADPAWESVDQRLTDPGGSETVMLGAEELTAMFGDLEPGASPADDLPPDVHPAELAPAPAPADALRVDELDEEAAWERRPDAFTSGFDVSPQPGQEWDIAERRPGTEPGSGLDF